MRAAFLGEELGEANTGRGGRRSGKAFRLKKQRERRHKGVELRVSGARKAN